MQYGQGLYRLIIKVIIADPTLGTVYVLKVDFINSF